MKIDRIDRNGVLFIERGGTYIKQKCPLASHMTNCCDMCPMFYERKHDNDNDNKCTEIKLLCIHDSLIFSVLDEREYKS